MCPELAEVLHRWKGGEVELTSSGDVVRLRLNRPEKSNCLSGEMMFQIGEKLRVCAFLRVPCFSYGETLESQLARPH